MKEEEKPQLYSKLTLVAFSALGTPFFAAIGYIMNLRAVGLTKYWWTGIVFAILYTLVVTQVIINFNLLDSGALIVTNILGGCVIAYGIQPNHIPNNLPHRKRSFLVPFLIFLTIFGILVFLNMMYP